MNLAWALFVLDPGLMGGYLNTSLGYGDLCVLAWFVASAATVGGGLGTGLESDEAIRAAAYSKREEERRTQLARRGPSRPVCEHPDLPLVARGHADVGPVVSREVIPPGVMRCCRCPVAP